MKYRATSAVLFHDEPNWLSPVLCGVAMTYEAMNIGMPSEWFRVQQSARDFEILAGPVLDPLDVHTVWYKIDITKEIADIGSAWLPMYPGSYEPMAVIV